MALTSTLYTGLSGIDVNQTRLQVIGNNIANANTVAYKSSRALFKPQFYITDSDGAPATSSFGGTNPSQRGLGAVVATVDKDFTTGTIQPTGKDNDMAIDGKGFFVVNSDKQRYTRDGSFTLNDKNELVNSSGDFVQGYGVDANGNVVQGVLQNIVIPVGSDTIAKATQNVAFKGNLNADGAVALAGTVLESQTMADVNGSPVGDLTLLVDLRNVSDNSAAFTSGQVLSLDAKRGGRSIEPATFSVDGTTTVAQLKAFMNQNMGLNAAVTQVPPVGADMVPDLTSPTPGAAKFTINGYYGTQNDLEIKQQDFEDASGVSPFTFNKTTTASGESTYTTLEVYDSLGTPLTLQLTTSLQSKSDTGIVWRFEATSPDNATGDRFVETGTLTFNNEGKLLSSTGSPLSISRGGTGAKPLSMYLDFGQMTSLTVEQGGMSKMIPQSQDGYRLGTLTSSSIGADGAINGAYSNGLTKTIGQIAVATFNNPNGLKDDGGNRFEANANSGVAVITAPQQLGSGSIRAGSLEMSNVDLSSEFINMIIASSGFSASSRVISTSDQLLTELLQSVR